jgi:transcriptional regulator with GAF, ATPase, and Fis domain
LRVLQEGEFERVGGTQTLKVDVRVVAATNRDLEQMVHEGKFRQDLYYRLNVFPIHNLPLRERREDIPPLVRHFVDKFTAKIGGRITEIPTYALEKLMHYEFPGNVRELENIVERAVILTKGNTLNLDISSIHTAKSAGSSNNFKTLEEVQREYILEALRRTNGQVSGDFGAAKILDINDKTLASRMKKLNISRTDYLEDK